MPKTRGGNEFWVGPTFEEDDIVTIDSLLQAGWTVVGITSAENSGGVWAMLVRPSTRE